MAQKQDVYLVDDMTGEVLYDEPGTTVTFAWDGVTYDIDVSEKTYRDMRELFGAYVVNARKRKRGGKLAAKSNPSPDKSERERNQRIRAAAVAAGDMEEGMRGRIPDDIKEKFANA